MKHKRPNYTIQMFVEDEDDSHIKCPKCNNELSEVKKCLKCGGKNIFEDVILD